MIKRNAENYLKQVFKKYPIITITGPRQSGKTTIAKKVFPELSYYNLEFPDLREFAIEDPRGFLDEAGEGVIIDEIQRAPELPSYIQGIVDEKRKNSLYILTGSQQFEVMAKISQSLAGRTALLRLLPFDMEEIEKGYGKQSIDEYLLKGGYPRIYDQKLNPTLALGDYFSTYIERDLRQLQGIKNLTNFENFVRICAGRVGQVLNLNSISNDIGISHTTAREWITVLQASYIIYLLKPFHVNIRKRLIKSPKIYFYDTGFAAYLLGIENQQHLKYHPLYGNLFENFVVAELLKYRFNQGKSDNIYFYRDSNQNEVDILFQSGDSFIPIEVKAAKTLSRNQFKGLNYFKKFFNQIVTESILVYRGSMRYKRYDTEVISPDMLTSYLEKIS